MSIDLLKRIEYEDVFDFDKFHETLKNMMEVVKGGESSTLVFIIEYFHDLWRDYDLSKSAQIAKILEEEVAELYGIVADPDDNIVFPKPKKPEKKPKKPSIRDLAKEFLENKTTPQELDDILEYVNKHRERPTSRISLSSSLCQDKEVIVHFKDGKWGLRSIDYSKQLPSYGSHFTQPNEDASWKVEEAAPTYNIERTNLSTQSFELRYSTKREHKPAEFFTKALSNSSQLDLGLGYFSSACFNVLACGFAHFVKNGGNMRLYINPNVTEEDYNLLKGLNDNEIEQYLINSYDSLLKIFSRRDELFFRCLSYLISHHRIEIKIVVLKDNGIAHEKFGIFTDTEGNEVAFTGSMNLTAAGLTKNIESIDAICSWHSPDENNRIKCYHEDFNDIWEKKNPEVMVFPADEFCRRIVTEYPASDIDDLVRLENEALKELITDNIVVSQDDPHFPLKYTDGPMPYQEEAYQEWVKNDRKGVFAMATGTGKTVTALNCALKEYSVDGFYHLLILVPSLALVEQWTEEVRSFNFRNIVNVSSENSSWKQELTRISMRMTIGRNVNYVIISTYSSFVMGDFQLLFPKISPYAILIADEAHNIGSASVRAAFRKLTLTRRIALSATPNRIYDEEGTREIESFFNDSYPYTYSFSMRRAIREQRLMPYLYYPYPVKLEDDEMEEYARITRQLIQLSKDDDGYSDPEEAKRLLLIRKNILHKARNKMIVFRNIIEAIGEEKLKFCFVYSAAGKRVRNDEVDDEQLDEYILKEMQGVLKSTFPNVTCNSYTGEDSKEMRKQKLTAFAEGQLNVLFAKNCLDEGVDIPRAEYGIFTSSTGNPRQFVQRRGRLLRKHPDKHFAQIYDMVVVPDFYSPYYEKRFWRMEKKLVENEMRRVANFCSMADNYYSGALTFLDDIISFYEIDLDGMVLNEEDN